MSATSRRAFSALASKIHPQLPLTPRESQQLLSLLTSSFRAHLDREHPVAAPPDRSQKSLVMSNDATNMPARAESSYSSASQHIDSILTSPLFAVKPRRRSSEATSGDARAVLTDPAGWFLEKIATGTASIPQAAMCLEMLEKTDRPVGQGALRGHAEREPGTLVAEWLRDSGLDKSREFTESAGKHGPVRLIERLARRLQAEGQEAFLWQWFLRHPDARVKETGLSADRILAFRAQILRSIVEPKFANPPSFDEGLATFIRAHDMVASPEYGLTHKVLQPMGASIMNHIIHHPHAPMSLHLYESFLFSAKNWTGAWRRGIQSILWLHHPSEPTAAPGLAYIRSPKGAAQLASAEKMSPTRRRLLVHLCLGVARQLLAEENFTDAQFVMQFTSENFPELVSSRKPVPKAGQRVAALVNRRKEQKNLEILDQLLPI